jgi:heme-degrading monooxygenase HmoA
VARQPVAGIKTETGRKVGSACTREWSSVKPSAKTRWTSSSASIKRTCCPGLTSEPGFDSARLLVEEEGNMAVSLTVWRTREDCLRYHSSRSYRQFVARTQHLLAGNFVVKIFRTRE